jgi:hypothetical protein
MDTKFWPKYINGRLVCRYGQILKNCTVGNFPSVWGAFWNPLPLLVPQYWCWYWPIIILSFFEYYQLSSLFSPLLCCRRFNLRLACCSFGLLPDKHDHSTYSLTVIQKPKSLAYHISIINKFSSHSNTTQFYFYCHLELCYFMVSGMHCAWPWNHHSVSLHRFAFCCR